MSHQLSYADVMIHHLLLLMADDDDLMADDDHHHHFMAEGQLPVLFLFPL